MLLADGAQVPHGASRARVDGSGQMFAADEEADEEWSILLRASRRRTQASDAGHKRLMPDTSV